MSSLPKTVRVHQALAQRFPVPMDSRELRALLGLSPREVASALSQCLKCHVIRRVRAVGIRNGYGYTVVTE